MELSPPICSLSAGVTKLFFVLNQIFLSPLSNWSAYNFSITALKLGVLTIFLSPLSNWECLTFFSQFGSASEAAKDFFTHFVILLLYSKIYDLLLACRNLLCMGAMLLSK